MKKLIDMVLQPCKMNTSKQQTNEGEQIMCAFKGSSPSGYRAEVREAEDGFSLFTWFDSDITGVILWREVHGMEWTPAFERACDWLNTKKAGG